MDTFKFDAVARLLGSGMTRREALRGLVAGAATFTAGGGPPSGRGRLRQAATPEESKEEEPGQ